MTLDKSQLKTLKQLSHHLEPIILMGGKGLTAAVHKEIELALDSHELIKIKLSSKEKAEKELLTETICKKHDATLVAQIGHVITIYKKSLKPIVSENTKKPTVSKRKPSGIKGTKKLRANKRAR
jgi:RNA-binding protein